MRTIGLFWVLCVIAFPSSDFAEIIPITLPDSYIGYQPVGLSKSSNGYILAGNVENPEMGWDVSLLWLSQDYSFIKQLLLSGDRSDLASKILRLKDNLLLLSNTSSNSGDLQKRRGLLDIGILKLDQDGNKLWTNYFGGNGINYAQDICGYADENTVAVVGWFNASGGDIPKVYGGWDIVVAKYDTLGELKWVKTLGAADDDMSGSILCDKGNINVVYNSWVKDRQWDLKFVTLDQDGNLIEEKSYGGSGSEIVHKIIKTHDENFIILGSTDSAEIERNNARGKIDIWIIKIDAQGNILWQTRRGGSEDDLGHDIALGRDGSYWVLGSTESHDGDVTKHIGGWDICIFNIDDHGHLVDSEIYGTLDDDQPMQILPMQTEVLFLCGTKKTDVFSEPFLIKKKVY